MAKKMTKRLAKRRQRYKVAWRRHKVSKSNLGKAARDVDRFQTCLFGALKYHERMVENYTVTAKALSVFDR